MTTYEAVTAYGAPIPRAFKDRAHAIQWAEENREVFPGCRIIARLKSGARTIWRDVQAQTGRAA